MIDASGGGAGGMNPAPRSVGKRNRNIEDLRKVAMYRYAQRERFVRCWLQLDRRHGLYVIDEFDRRHRVTLDQVVQVEPWENLGPCPAVEELPPTLEGYQLLVNYRLSPNRFWETQAVLRTSDRNFPGEVAVLPKEEEAEA
jgi:hypothetical protein